MQQYSEAYTYDSVGNLLLMAHDATVATSPTPGVFKRIWSRTYQLDTASNRLLSTTVGSVTSTYGTPDDAGNTLQMPHLPKPDWDYRNQLQHATLGSGAG